MDQNKFELRRQMRQRRRELSATLRAHAARRFAQRFCRSAAYRRSRDIAVYWCMDGEMALWPLIHRAWRDGKRIYLPVLTRHGRRTLWFRRYRPDTTLRVDHYGIPEPVRSERGTIPLRRLDLVLAPLVAFDRRGNRLGMGGGYYDRTFSFIRHHPRWQHPRLVGVAYAFQEVDALPSQPWDVPLWGACTEAGLRAFPARG